MKINNQRKFPSRDFISINSLSLIIFKLIIIIKSNNKINKTFNIGSGIGTDINKITWLNGTTPIAVDDIKTKQTELQTAYDNNKYQRDRAKEYPSIVDQLDDIYHNGIDGWKATIKTTKDKYPKESE